jgi:hypothetical protein
MSTGANWAGVFKRRYAPFVNPLPSENTLAEHFEFVSQDRRPGENYNFPVLISNEHGVTFDVSQTAFSLNAAIDSVTKNAQLDGATIMMVANIPYDVAAKTMNGSGDGGGDGGSYWPVMDGKVKFTMAGAELYRELAIAYGPGTAAAALGNIGVVAASVSGANLAAPQVVRLTVASWAAGIWNMLQNAKVDIYQSDGSTLRESDVTVTGVPSSTQTRLTLTKTGSVAVVAANDIIVPAGARTKSCIGVQPILENATTMFGIDAAQIPQWRALTYSAASAAMGRAKLLQMAARLYPNGNTNGGTLFVSGMTFAELAEEADALQRYTGNTDEVKRQGASALEYKSAIGNITVKLYRFQKSGQAFFLPGKICKRVGSTDLTWQLPGTNEKFALELPNNAGFQIRMYGNMAPVIEIPYWCAIVTAIVNTGDVASS